MVAALVELRLKTAPGFRGDNDACRPSRPAETAIFVTEFDEDGFLDFRLLGGSATRRARMRLFTISHGGATARFGKRNSMKFRRRSLRGRRALRQ